MDRKKTLEEKTRMNVFLRDLISFMGIATYRLRMRLLFAIIYIITH